MQDCGREYSGISAILIRQWVTKNQWSRRWRNLPQPMVYRYIFIYPLQFLTTKHSVYNSLQFFQWCVVFQCSGQSYGSSGSKITFSEAAMGYADMNILEVESQFHIKQIPCFCCYGNDNSSPPEETMILVWASVGNDTFHSTIYRYATITKTCS